MVFSFKLGEFLGQFGTPHQTQSYTVIVNQLPGWLSGNEQVYLYMRRPVHISVDDSFVRVLSLTLDGFPNTELRKVGETDGQAYVQMRSV